MTASNKFAQVVRVLLPHQNPAEVLELNTRLMAPYIKKLSADSETDRPKTLEAMKKLAEKRHHTLKPLAPAISSLLTSSFGKAFLEGTIAFPDHPRLHHFETVYDGERDQKLEQELGKVGITYQIVPAKDNAPAVLIIDPGQHDFFSKLKVAFIASKLNFDRDLYKGASIPGQVSVKATEQFEQMLPAVFPKQLQR